MSDLRTESINFKSADGQTEVKGWLYTWPGVTPKALLQISHGMCEYMGRYLPFIEFMTQHGYAVCGNDHLGHGQTSVSEETDGFFAEKDGRFYVLRDLKSMNELARSRFPAIPVFLLGHSMGSFFARWFATEYSGALNGLIISGTGGPNPLSGIGLALTNRLAKKNGAHFRSEQVHKMAFGTYLKRIRKPDTEYDWISRDKEIVAAYAADPKCTYMFTVSAFHELMATLQTVSEPEWAASFPLNVPVYLFSGAEDPVGGYGKGVRTVYNRLRAAGVEDVSLKLYPGGRHEMLNETNRASVYEDVLDWCDTHVL